MNVETAHEDPERIAADYDPHDLEQAQDPHAIYAKLRQRCPIAHSEQQGGFWLITRYKDIEAITHDPATFSSKTLVVPKDFYPEDVARQPPINLDPPDHTAFRRLLLPTFSQASAAKMEPLIRETCVAALADFVAAGTCDAATDYARRVPVSVIFGMLGIPKEDNDRFTSWVHTIMGSGLEKVDEAMAAGMEMGGYLAQLVATHRSERPDDFTTDLLECEYEGQRLTDQEIIQVLFMVVVAGIDTTWSMIGSCLYHLASFPDDRRRLVENPSLLPSAVEEFLRLYAPVSVGRLVVADTELEGVKLSKGEMVLLSYPSANRDEAMFPNPDAFVPDRDGNRHAGFGVGIHRCLGAHIGRLEMRIALEEWLARIPEFELAGEVVWQPGQVWGPHRLPVVFPPVS